MDLERLGAVLRERREAVGIPRTEIARRVGVTPTYIWLVEGARPRKGGEPSKPTESVLSRWAKALGMDDRYTRQLLALGGYGEGIPSMPTPQQHVIRQSVNAREAPLPPIAAGHASMPGSTPPSLAGTDRSARAFAQAPVSFPQPRDLEIEVLVEQVRETMAVASTTDRKWEDSRQLLESFLAWLRFRIEDET